ncbi:MAG: hypothetical protein Q9179_002731 [Wetmoreana sp. 5 TL-2023]
MSRPKLVKTMNLNRELDDYDGADYDDDFDASDEPLLQQGVQKVRAVLGPSVDVSNEDIEDSLWHYYYDVDKTVNYLLQQKAPAQPKKSVKRDRTPTNGALKELPLSMFRRIDHCCYMPLSIADFFADAPWLNVPKERRGEILIEPLYPRGGLPGGSPIQDGTKTSKLAALAAARKKKENEKLDNVEPRRANASVALLEKLTSKAQNDEPSNGKGLTGSKFEAAASTEARISAVLQPRKYPNKGQESLHAVAPGSEDLKSSSPSISDNGESALEGSMQLMPTAAPSAFAQTIFRSLHEAQPSVMESFRSLALSLPQTSRSDAKSSPFAGPSPDDIVTKAQSSSKGATAVKKVTPPAKDVKANKDLSESVAEVTIDEGPKPKSKNLDVLAEFGKVKAKNAANFVVIGHVDAGKSTLMGRLLYDLNVVDQRTIHKYRKEAERIGKSSFALAWVLDQGTEERDRGVTMDIAVNKFETSKTSFTILDAPGHRDFIPNMIAGASQADFAVLVIDASTGSFESGLRGQTKEHALLIRSMGVQRIVIAVNKLDTVQWSKDRFDEIQQQVSAFLTTAGFQSKNIAFVPCSGLTGDNIARRAQDPRTSWYTGPILVEQLEVPDPAQRALDKPLRLTISDTFRGGVQNPLSISGRLESGSIQVGDKVVAMPASETAIIRGIEVDADPADWAVAGQNVILHLTDLEAKYLKPGDVICPPSAPIKNVTSFSVKILAFDHITPMRVEVHRGRLHVPGKITQLVAVLDKGTGAVVGKKKPRLVQPGSVARVVVEVETAVPLEAPGRVVLRAGGETVAAGLLE